MLKYRISDERRSIIDFRSKIFHSSILRDSEFLVRYSTFSFGFLSHQVFTSQLLARGCARLGSLKVGHEGTGDRDQREPKSARRRRKQLKAEIRSSAPARGLFAAAFRRGRPLASPTSSFRWSGSRGRGTGENKQNTREEREGRRK